MAPKLSSNAHIFAKLGNPWISLREAIHDFGRNPVSENPDLDRYLYATKARGIKAEIVRVKPEEKSAMADASTRNMNARRALNKKIIAQEKGRFNRVK